MHIVSKESSLTEDPWHKREAQKYDNPIASREHILATMEALGKPVAFKRLAKILDLETPVNRDALRSRLGAMVRAGQLVVDVRNVYAIASRLELIAGKVSAHPDGFGFLITDKGEDDIFLSMRQMKAVFHGDKALVRVRGLDRRGRPEGEIIEVVERHTEQLVGRLYFEGELALVEPLNNRINHKVRVSAGLTPIHRAGQIVVVRIIEQPALHGMPTAELLETLGDSLTPALEVEVALRNNDIPTTWSEEVLEAVDRMPNTVGAQDTRDRVDLRDLPFVTIDGEDARDFDDAVYCEPKKSGGWRLFVAIADVAHYVEAGSPLDRSAFDRGTSVYFPQYVVPMLPEKLSNGLCSLNPRVDRLALVCEMTVSSRGKVSGYRFYEAVINSRARLTYTQVARAINGDTDASMHHVEPFLTPLNALFHTLAQVRAERGTLDFDSTELLFNFDDAGKVVSIVPRARNAAHRLIEECMLSANVCAARFIARHGKPGLYRVHEVPAEEKIEYLREFLGRFGIPLRDGLVPTPKDFQAVIDQLRGRKNGHVLQMAVLRSMNQAVYQPVNKGHFGLNFPEYTHFTSPIRRYPDLLVHRLIKSVIHSRLETAAVVRVGVPKKTNFYPYEMEEVIAMGEHTSFAERRADAAVYDVLEWIKCDYVSDRVGDILEGVITGVAKFGFFVELTDIYVEGLVHVSTLGGDYYQYDQGSQCLVGERTRQVYGLGDAVSVQISRVNVDERKIDFELTSHSPLTGRRKSGKDKARKKPSAGGKKKKNRRS